MTLAVRRLAALLLLLAGLWSGPGVAHESQPGLLEVRQLTTERWEIAWRAPIYYGQPHPARLALPPDWQPLGEPRVRRLASAELYRQILRVPPGSVDGSVIGFPGLEQTITDVFVRLHRLDGSEMSQVVRPTEPQVVLRGERPWTVSAREYLALGFHHILLGIDHLLFVLGLLVIVRGPRMLIETITAFTLAHSLTLGLATLGHASLPAPPLNAAIALSILFLGPEMVRVWRGETSFTIRHPWVVAFCFGLLHGFGFASGLSTVAMPRAEIPLALAMFNVGVELGQLAFVALILLAHRALRTLEFRWPRCAELGPAYAVGTLGAYWTLQRTAMLF
ncbi:HupE/UreJ family protein [Thiorhodococcus minor]|uniref:HupE/UreJ family protein n=1 Tax=Thiorhodococcus minor TaxID=57489 RepID=A0A6M0K3H6_9GAMM|nr:HupE/UreJ family protein [Thiorhodococcus minor]NEV64326.1 HupE/UreJ family protein [Thiorhodococcus minor]